MVSAVGAKQSLASGEARREAILQVVGDYWTDYQRPPSIAEIARAVGLRSKNAVREHVDFLVEQGVLAKAPLRKLPQPTRFYLQIGREEAVEVTKVAFALAEARYGCRNESVAVGPRTPTTHGFTATSYVDEAGTRHPRVRGWVVGDEVAV